MPKKVNNDSPPPGMMDALGKTGPGKFLKEKFSQVTDGIADKMNKHTSVAVIVAVAMLALSSLIIYTSIMGMPSWVPLPSMMAGPGLANTTSLTFSQLILPAAGMYVGIQGVVLLANLVKKKAANVIKSILSVAAKIVILGLAVLSPYVCYHLLTAYGSGSSQFILGTFFSGICITLAVVAAENLLSSKKKAKIVPRKKIPVQSNQKVATNKA